MCQWQHLLDSWALQALEETGQLAPHLCWAEPCILLGTLASFRPQGSACLQPLVSVLSLSLRLSLVSLSSQCPASFCDQKTVRGLGHL